MLRLKSLGYVTQGEVAEILKKPRQTIYRWDAKGELPKPVLRQSRLIIWRLRDIERYKNGNRRTNQ